MALERGAGCYFLRAGFHRGCARWLPQYFFSLFLFGRSSAFFVSVAACEFPIGWGGRCVWRWIGVQHVIFLGLGFVVAGRGGSASCSFRYLFLGGLLIFLFRLPRVNFPIGWGGLCVWRWIGVQNVIFLGLARLAG